MLASLLGLYMRAANGQEGCSCMLHDFSDCLDNRTHESLEGVPKKITVYLLSVLGKALLKP